MEFKFPYTNTVLTTLIPMTKDKRFTLQVTKFSWGRVCMGKVYCDGKDHRDILEN